MQMSDDARDRYIAPDISRFTSTTIPDVSKAHSQQQHWLNNYILNTMLRVQMSDPDRQRLFNFLRRVQAAFQTYAAGREATLAYLHKRETSHYMEAINDWEACVTYCWQAYELLAKKGWYTKEDGSPLERLHDMYTAAKHADKWINQRLLLHDSPLVVWLTNDGLRSTDDRGNRFDLTFVQLSELLQQLTQLSSAIQDPLTMKETIRGQIAAPGPGSH